MNKRPGQVTVTTEVGYCSFCARPRNIRREERHLGALVRTTVTCETCHRTLASTVGVAGADAPAPEAPAPQPASEPEAAATPERPAPARRTPKPKATAAKAAAKPKTATRRPAPKK